MEVPDEMLAAKDALAAALSAVLPFLPGVQGVNVGLRQDGVELTDELVLRVLVTDTDAVPEGLDAQIADAGFPVVVVEREMSPLLDDGVHDPLVGGITVRTAHGALLISRGAGTLGGFATDTMFGGVVGVSCAHVLAESDQAVQQGDPVYQPDTNRPVGQLFRWSDATDMAVFAVDDGVAVDASIADIGAVSGMAGASVGDLIGLAPLGVGTPANSFEIYARDITAPILCKPGDSGSLVINEQDEVVGILTQKGVEYSRIVTVGSAPDGAISGFATQTRAPSGGGRRGGNQFLTNPRRGDESAVRAVPRRSGARAYSDG
jgi:hypothetical protein